MRPNEAFSGRGHARHLCRECAKLGADELAYRQEVRDIDRLLGWSGLIRRKTREVFQRYLSHPNPRVRAYAIEVAAHDAREREERARFWEAIELEEAMWAERSGITPDVVEGSDDDEDQCPF
jgi:hypothetical protein